MPADFGHAIPSGLVNAIGESHPGIKIELMLTHDYLDLVAEGVDIAIRVGELIDSTLIAKRVGIACWAPVASPEYLRNAPPLDKPQQLRKHHCLQFTSRGKDL